jgi:hypothetical protein
MRAPTVLKEIKRAVRSDIIGWSSIPPLRDCAGIGHAGAARIQSDFNAKAQRRRGRKFLWRVGYGHCLASRIDPASSALRLRVFAVQSRNFVTLCEDFPGARVVPSRSRIVGEWRLGLSHGLIFLRKRGQVKWSAWLMFN